MTLFAVLGVVLAIIGVAVLATALRGRVGTSPRSTAMMIGGMMLTALGLILAGFAFVYSHTAPLDLNAGTAR